MGRGEGRLTSIAVEPASVGPSEVLLAGLKAPPRPPTGEDDDSKSLMHCFIRFSDTVHSGCIVLSACRSGRGRGVSTRSQSGCADRAVSTGRSALCMGHCALCTVHGAEHSAHCAIGQQCTGRSARASAVQGSPPTSRIEECGRDCEG